MRNMRGWIFAKDFTSATFKFKLQKFSFPMPSFIQLHVRKFLHLCPKVAITNLIVLYTLCRRYNLKKCMGEPQ